MPLQGTRGRGLASCSRRDCVTERSLSRSASESGLHRSRDLCRVRYQARKLCKFDVDAARALTGSIGDALRDFGGVCKSHLRGLVIELRFPRSSLWTVTQDRQLFARTRFICLAPRAENDAINAQEIVAPFLRRDLFSEVVRGPFLEFPAQWP
jgi:hypothetical protein